MRSWLVLLVLALGVAGAEGVVVDSFGKYLAARRTYRVSAAANPHYADELLGDLQKHLRTVAQWIDGKVDRPAMREALQFFHGKYRGRGWIYRGTAGERYDGQPASFTRKRAIAEGFAKAAAQSGKNYFVIKRKSPATSIDFGKLLKTYASGSHYRSDEAEVVALNTWVSPGNVTEYTV